MSSRVVFLFHSLYGWISILQIKSPAVYPRLVVNYYFRYYKLYLIKPFRGSPEFPNQNFKQISPGVPELWSDKQTEITSLCK